MTLPLYQGAMEFSRQREDRNQGLYFDKFFDRWNFQDPSKTDKKTFLDELLKEIKTNRTKQLLTDYRQRRHRLVRKLNGRIFESKTLWRLVSGLGSANPTEAGFIWHRTLGVPYLPGSSLKGALRTWLTHWGQGEADRINELFGGTDTFGQGRLIVFDALPTVLPKLDLDVMNPHYTPYYDKIDNPDALQINPPADYYAPIPVFFLTVAPGQSFEFLVAPTPGLGTPKDMEDGVKILNDALTMIGIGAKTAVGYGVFGEFDDKTKSIFDRITEAEKAEEQARLEKLSPFERYCYLLESGLKQYDQSQKEKMKDNSMELYKELVNLSDAEKLRAAMLLRDTWGKTGDWDGKMSEKQVKKVAEIKYLLTKNDVK